MITQALVDLFHRKERISIDESKNSFICNKQNLKNTHLSFYFLKMSD
jgi:hypothetical protein